MLRDSQNADTIHYRLIFVKTTFRYTHRYFALQTIILSYCGTMPLVLLLLSHDSAVPNKFVIWWVNAEWCSCHSPAAPCVAGTNSLVENTIEMSNQIPRDCNWMTISCRCRVSANFYRTDWANGLNTGINALEKQPLPECWAKMISLVYAGGLPNGVTVAKSDYSGALREN